MSENTFGSPSNTLSDLYETFLLLQILIIYRLNWNYVDWYASLL